MNLDKWRAAFHWNGRKGNRILRLRKEKYGAEKKIDGVWGGDSEIRFSQNLGDEILVPIPLSIRFRFVSIAKF